MARLLEPTNAKPSAGGSPGKGKRCVANSGGKVGGGICGVFNSKGSKASLKKGRRPCPAPTATRNGKQVELNRRGA